MKNGRSMMRIQVVLALVFISVASVSQAQKLPGSDPKPGEKLIQSIPKSERSDFLSYALGHGFMDQFRFPSGKFPFPKLLRIPNHLEDKFQTVRKPANFTSDLYLFVKSTYRLTSAEMFALILFKKFCFPHTGRCVDLENIGEMCCPF